MLATFLMTLAIFFDDYANSLLVGNTMRPISDKQKISARKIFVYNRHGRSQCLVDGASLHLDCDGNWADRHGV